jgi:hypothetical protein
MGLFSSPSYQDYLNYYKAQFGNASEGSGGALSEDQWKSLGSSGQWNQIGGGTALGSDDSRWADLASQLGIKDTSGPDGTVMIYGGNKPSNPTGLVDPSRVVSGDGSYAFAHSNFTPQAEFAGGGMSDKMWALSALGLVGGGAALGGAMGWGGAAADGASASLPESYWSTLADSGQVATDAAVGGAPVTDLSVAAQTGAPVVDHSVAASSGLFGNSGGLLSQAGNWIASNPLKAIGLAQTAYGLLGGHGTAGGSSSNGSGSKGGSGVAGPAMKVGTPQYYVNPYIAAQIQRGYGR